MNALELLKQDHQKVKELFHEATRAEQNKRKDLFDKIDTELETHAHIEETVFYPALEQHEELKDMVTEALEEASGADGDRRTPCIGRGRGNVSQSPRGFR
jgi:hemerythrin superfamily protein